MSTENCDIEVLKHVMGLAVERHSRHDDRCASLRWTSCYIFMRRNYKLHLHSRRKLTILMQCSSFITSLIDMWL
jgi:hypothetical protein